MRESVTHSSDTRWSFLWADWGWMIYTPHSASPGHQLSNYYITPNRWMQTETLPFLCKAKGFCRNDIMIWTFESTQHSAASSKSFKVKVSEFRAPEALHHISPASLRSDAERLTQQFPPAAANTSGGSVCRWLWLSGSMWDNGGASEEDRYSAIRSYLDTEGVLSAAAKTHRHWGWGWIIKKQQKNAGWNFGD